MDPILFSLLFAWYLMSRGIPDLAYVMGGRMPLRYQKMKQAHRRNAGKGDPGQPDRYRFRDFMRDRWDECWRDADKWVRTRRAAKEGKPAEEWDILPIREDQAPAVKSADDSDLTPADSAPEIDTAESEPKTTSDQETTHVHRPGETCDCPTNAELRRIHDEQLALRERCAYAPDCTAKPKPNHRYCDSHEAVVAREYREEQNQGPGTTETKPEPEPTNRPNLTLISAIRQEAPAMSAPTSYSGSAEITNIESVRTFSGELQAHVAQQINPEIERAIAAMRNAGEEHAVDKYVLAMAKFNEAIGIIEEGVTELNDRHGLMEEAVNSTEAPAQTEFYQHR